MKWAILALVLCLSFFTNAQKVFTEADLVAVVKKYHPVARQALLDVHIADAALLASRASFDPVATFDNSRKSFDGTTYYNTQWSELKIPTWYGIDVYAGTETVKGSRVNPEKTSGSINYIGVSVPLLQNLLLDKRRAAVQQAKIYREQSATARRAAVNDLLAEALQSYWNWWKHYQVLALTKASLQNAATRLAMVKTAFRLGDRPAIDTLEAATQVQLFKQHVVGAEMNLQKSMLELAVYLWTEKEQAYELPQDAVPEQLENKNEILLDTLLLQAQVHPELLDYDYKLSVLKLEKRLKFQLLLPEVYAKYNSLGRNFSETFNEAFFQNNYKFGVSVAMPLRLSEGRGAYKTAKLKIDQTRLQQQLKQVTIANKVKQFYTEWQQTILQQEQQKNLVANYTALQKGEETKFSNGESSLFLVNARELKTIESQQKLIELTSKIQVAHINIRWSAGLLSEL